MKVRLRVRLKSVKGDIAPVVISSSVNPAFGPETELEEKWKKNRQRSAENALANESEIRRLCREGLSMNELARMFRTTRLLILCICRSGDLKWACERYIEEGLWFSQRGDRNVIELKDPKLWALPNVRPVGENSAAVIGEPVLVLLDQQYAD
jgi:hypothetical protein